MPIVDKWYRFRNVLFLVETSQSTTNVANKFVAVTKTLSNLVGYSQYQNDWGSLLEVIFFRQNRKRILSDPYLFDAFVSYSSEDKSWVLEQLVRR